MSQNSLTQLLSTFAGDEEDVAAVTALGSSHKFDSPVRNGQQSYDNPSWQKTTQGSVVAYVQNLPPTADELFLYKTFLHSVPSRRSKLCEITGLVCAPELRPSISDTTRTLSPLRKRSNASTVK